MVGRLAARLLVVTAVVVAATALGAGLALMLGADAPPTHAPLRSVDLSTGAAPTRDSYIVLAELPRATLTPTRPPLPTATILPPSPTPTATQTRAPTVTPTVSPTTTPAPSDTPEPRPTSTPILPTSTPTNPPEPTPPSFAAPPLFAPESGRAFSEDEVIDLVWGSVGELPPGVFYVITLAYPHGDATWYDETPWTQGTSWRMSDHGYLLDLADGGQLRWSVQVKQHTGTGADGRPAGVPLGPESETRTLIWRRSSGGGGSGSRNTPEPPPP